MNSASSGAPSSTRQALRDRLLAAREKFVAGPDFESANGRLAQHLRAVLHDLEPEGLGLYWPYKFEFNAVAALMDDPACAKLPIYLPFAQRHPPRMHYRAWTDRQATPPDDCGIPSATGREGVPDVVVVPCVGYLPNGCYRLGYGGGYFDRWLAAHPDVTTVGVAWRIAAIADDEFVPAAHDLPLNLVITEDGVA